MILSAVVSKARALMFLFMTDANTRTEVLVLSDCYGIFEDFIVNMKLSFMPFTFSPVTKVSCRSNCLFMSPWSLFPTRHDVHFNRSIKSMISEIVEWKLSTHSSTRLQHRGEV